MVGPRGGRPPQLPPSLKTEGEAGWARDGLIYTAHFPPTGPAGASRPPSRPILPARQPPELKHLSKGRKGNQLRLPQ